MTYSYTDASKLYVQNALDDDEGEELDDEEEDLDESDDLDEEEDEDM